jgi:hypothetical protein
MTAGIQITISVTVEMIIATWCRTADRTRHRPAIASLPATAAASADRP